MNKRLEGVAMSYANPDVYFQPEKFDLKPIGELEISEPDWSFDTVVAWIHTPTGDVYWAHDSGCSCPSPFEDYTDLVKLTKLSTENYGT
jgi:hypothetical protein